MPDDAAVKLGHWLEVVRRTRIGRTVKGIAFVLASYADTDGNNIFPSLATLAVAAEVDYKTAKRSLADLVQLGLIEKVARRSGARGRFDEYRLILAPDLLSRTVVPTPEEFQTAVESVREANRSKAVRTGARVPRTEAVHIDADDGMAESVRGTARPKNRVVRGTGSTSYGERRSGVPLIAPLIEKLPLMPAAVAPDSVTNVEVRPPPKSQAIGFCLRCYEQGQITLAVDSVAGDACEFHLTKARKGRVA